MEQQVASDVGFMKVSHVEVFNFRVVFLIVTLNARGHAYH